MLAKISWNPNNVVESGDGYVIVKLDDYTDWKNAGNVIVTQGSTYQEYENNPALSNKAIHVGQKGGLRFN